MENRRHVLQPEKDRQFSTVSKKTMPIYEQQLKLTKYDKYTLT